MNKSSQEIATVNTEANNGKRKKPTATRRITYIATLVALALLLKLVSQVLQTPSFKFTLIYIPWIISAMVMGPLGGAVVCFATDVIGTFILPTQGLPVPLIVFSNTLFGLIMGICFRIPKLSYRIKMLIGTVTVIAVCTLGISTMALADLYSIPYTVELGLRIPQALMVAINAALTLFLIPILRKISLIE